MLWIDFELPLYEFICFNLRRSGNLVVAFFITLSIFSKGVKADMPIFGVSTIAGTGSTGNSADGSKASSAAIGQASNVWLNPAGEIFIGDQGYDIARKVTTSGIMSRFAGSGSSTSSGNGGNAKLAGMSPYGICGDTANTYIYIAEFSLNTVRRIQVSNNILTGFAGGGSAINDNGKATSAKLSSPSSCAVDTVGNVYITDRGNSLIRKVTISSGIINIVAGVVGSTTVAAGSVPATSSPLNSPFQIYLDSTATLFINVKSHNLVRKIDLTSTSKTLVTVIGKFFIFIILFLVYFLVSSFFLSPLFRHWCFGQRKYRYGWQRRTCYKRQSRKWVRNHWRYNGKIVCE